MAVSKPLEHWAFPAAVDLSALQFTFVALNASGQLAVPAAGALAFALEDTPKAGEFGTVALAGVAKIVAGAALTPGQVVTTNNVGKAIPAGTGNASNGIALSAAANGDLVPVLVSPSGDIHA